MDWSTLIIAALAGAALAITLGKAITEDCRRPPPRRDQ